VTDRTDPPEDPGVAPRTSTPLIGFVGLGQMGAPMVQRLRDAEFQVIAHDHSATARQRFAGEAWLTATELASDLAECDVVVLMLPDSDAVEDVLVASGLGWCMRPDSTVIDMSSSDPARTRKLAAGLRAAGVRMIDAPVSGGVEGAHAGTLSIMAGGDEGDLDAWLPLLSRFGHSIVHVGGIGAGHATKALNNLLSATALLITGEAMLIARQFGLDPSVLLAAINGSSGRNSATERKFPSFVLPGTFSSGFSAQLMGKDIGIALSMAHQTGTPAPLAEQVLAYWTDLCQRIEPDADHTEVVRPQATDATAVLWPGPGQ
jgi:3-hydroxyisobutyrate dehydrogenase